MRALLLTVIFAIGCANAAQARQPATALHPDLDTSTTKVYRYAEQCPAFKGSWADFLQDKLVFPPAALHRIEADTALAGVAINERVIVQFIVCEDGRICNIEVTKCNPKFPELGEEVMRVVRLFPAWKPARIHRLPVKAYIALPFFFVTD